MDILESCTLCPRRCKVNRYEKNGYCGCGADLKVARAALHFWEEPCISGTKGSGTVFFSGCSLRCCYCQNKILSHSCFGKTISINHLVEIFSQLEAKGAHNLNLVTPTHYVPQIIRALDIAKPKIPVVYNCGGYETVKTLKILNDYVDIYLTDIKYARNKTARKYSAAPDYCDYAYAALCEMITQKPKPVIKNGIMESGVIVRHLVLPANKDESKELIKRLYDEYGNKSFVLSLLSQYTPQEYNKNYPELNRKITSLEYRRVTEYAADLGFEGGYMQERGSAKKEYTPPFDLTGV